MSQPVVMAAAARRAKLVLHFDVNETIMVGDPAGGVSFAQCLNIILAKSAALRRSAGGGGWTWHDGSPLEPAEREATAAVPPLRTDFRLPAGCEYFHAQFRSQAKTFTEAGPGVIYRG